MVSTCLGSMPAAARLSLQVPDAEPRQLTAGAGIDQDELRAGIDGERRERDRQRVGREEVVGERLLHVRPGGVAHELVVDLAVPDSVVDRGQLIAADLVAIDAGRLLAGRGRGRRRGSGRQGTAAAAVAEPARSARRVNSVMRASLRESAAIYRRGDDDFVAIGGAVTEA